MAGSPTGFVQGFRLGAHRDPDRTPSPQQRGMMSTENRHYSPQLDRFLVGALYHEAKRRRKPMTMLANELVTHALRDTGARGYSPPFARTFAATSFW